MMGLLSNEVLFTYSALLTGTENCGGSCTDSQRLMEKQNHDSALSSHNCNNYALCERVM